MRTEFDEIIGPSSNKNRFGGMEGEDVRHAQEIPAA
jgi:hypothetical protein